MFPINHFDLLGNFQTESTKISALDFKCNIESKKCESLTRIISSKNSEISVAFVNEFKIGENVIVYEFEAKEYIKSTFYRYLCVVVTRPNKNRNSKCLSLFFPYFHHKMFSS